MIQIRPFHPDDEPAVIGLWRRCDLLRPQNDPHKDIQRKLRVRPEWFLVATIDATIVGSVMAGYDGHRGWVYYLGADPSRQRMGIGRALMRGVERLLSAEGCPKINLQVRTSNRSVIAFHEAIGFTEDAVLSMGRRLEQD